MGVQFGGNPFFELFPFFLVCLLVDGTLLGFEVQSCFPDDREFVIFESQIFVPGNFSMITFGVMEDLAYAGRPVSILLKELGHGNRAGSGFSDVEGIVENPGALWVQTTEERCSGGSADGILTKGPVESDRFLGKFGKVGSGDGFVPGSGNMGVEIIADHKEDILSFGFYRFWRN